MNFKIFRHHNKWIYQEFDSEGTLLGGGDIAFLIPHLEKLLEEQRKS